MGKNIKTITADKPNISNLAFWDVNFEKIDFQKNSLFVIEKVLNYGVWSDFIELVKYYGTRRIKKEIVETPYLSKEVLNFVCFYFKLDLNKFQCYKQRQSQNQLWNY